MCTAIVNDYLREVGTKHWILQLHHLILLIMVSEPTLQGLFGKTKTFLDKMGRYGHQCVELWEFFVAVAFLPQYLHG
jgi:hypothetical protein